MTTRTKNLPREFETTPGSVIQSSRLTQIVLVTTSAIVISLVVLYFTAWRWGLVEQALCGALLVFATCHLLIFKHKEKLATTLYIVTVTAMSCYLIYNALGLRDESVIIFPAILLFACMFGSPRQFFVVLVSLIGFLGFVVLAHIKGWHRIQNTFDTDVNTFINVAVILIATGFFAYVLANDLRKALVELNRSRRELLDMNDLLEDRVRQRTEQFEQANKALQESMDKLEHAMNELVHAEKLASLGSMVAGISHELNTPIGNTLLAASSLEKIFEEIAERINAGHVKRSEFDEFIREGQEVASLITRSSKRAADLVVSFKQVAIDQTSEQRRSFDLRDVIEDNVKALIPNIKKKQIKIVNSVASEIKCNSFPGPLGQILTNLVQNAIIHGFDEKLTGTISIQAENQSKQVILTIRDDGAGMPQSVISHVFDPFFTTKLGKGGSGLGLSISHRIATSVLGGDLRVESTLGEGASFTIVLPKDAPFPI